MADFREGIDHVCKSIDRSLRFTKRKLAYVPDFRPSSQWVQCSMLLLPPRMRRIDDFLGHFDLSSWEVHEPFVEEDYVRSVSRYVNNQRRRTIAIPTSVMVQDFHVIRLREHEWTHFRQHISTPHGVFLHRLCGLQEQMTLLYFEARKDQSHRPVPFHVLINDETNYEAQAWLKGWIAAEVLRGLLWGKTAKMSETIDVWNLSTEVLSSHEKIFEGDLRPAKLITRRGPDAQSGPHGHLTFRDVAEGFAKFREFWHVANVMGAECAAQFAGLLHEQSYSYAARFIVSELGLRVLHHPFVGALLDAAMLTFVDPFMTDQDTLVWEDIHAGLRLESAVRSFAQTGRKVPESFSDCYFEALRSFGFDRSLPPTAVIWLRHSRPKKQLAKAKLTDPLGVQYYQRDAIVRAHALRLSNAGIYYVPSMVKETRSRKEFRDISRPPIIITPLGIFAPWGFGRNNRTIIPNLFHGLSARMLEEISHRGELEETVRFGRNARKYLRDRTASKPEAADLFSDDRIEQFVIGNLGETVRPIIRDAMEQT